jgi:ribonuclease HI
VRSSSKLKKQVNKPWCLPPHGWVKLTVDGSYKKEDGTAGSGMVLRDDMGRVIFSSCRSLVLCGDSLEAEVCACLEGIKLALQYCQLPMGIDTDGASDM